MSKVEQAIAEKDVKALRNLLKAYLTGDATDSDGTIKESLEKIAQSGIDIWEPHDGTTLKVSENEWNEEYFVDLQVELRMNFSKERFLHMLDVGKKVYGVPVVTTTAPPTETIRSTESTRKPEPSRPSETARPEAEKIYSQLGDDAYRKKNQALMWVAVGLGAVILTIILIKMFNSNN